MPENRRVHAGALLYTSAVFGLGLAMLVNYLIAGVLMVGDTAHSWRYVFLCGLIPAAVTLVVRRAVREPERWQAVHHVARARLAEIFSPALRARTISGMVTAVVAMITWWSCNAFLPIIVTGLARAEAAVRGFDPGATLTLVEQWKLYATAAFNAGGLLGTLLTIPLASRMGRRNMFLLYFACSAAAILCVYGFAIPSAVRIWLFFFVGLPVFGVFGAFPFYLPELFPTRLRATGGGFTYNIGRLVAAAGPPLVGAAAARGTAMDTVFYVGFVPVLGLLLAPWIIETRGQSLPD
jgi:MFS family permease